MNLCQCRWHCQLLYKESGCQELPVVSTRGWPSSLLNLYHIPRIYHQFTWLLLLLLCQWHKSSCLLMTLLPYQAFLSVFLISLLRWEKDIFSSLQNQDEVTVPVSIHHIISILGLIVPTESEWNVGVISYDQLSFADPITSSAPDTWAPWSRPTMLFFYSGLPANGWNKHKMSSDFCFCFLFA